MSIIEKMGVTDGIWNNRRLVESAPEMLEALIENYKMLEHIEYSNFHWRMKEAIQKATGKTWEEIKELL